MNKNTLFILALSAGMVSLKGSSATAASELAYLPLMNKAQGSNNIFRIFLKAAYEGQVDFVDRNYRRFFFLMHAENKYQVLPVKTADKRVQTLIHTLINENSNNVRVHEIAQRLQNDYAAQQRNFLWQ